VISYEVFRTRLGEMKLPPTLGGATLFRVLDDWREEKAYYGPGGLPLTEEAMDALARKVWRGIEEVVASAPKAKGP
jgi:hypothetical protein